MDSESLTPESAIQRDMDSQTLTPESAIQRDMAALKLSDTVKLAADLAQRCTSLLAELEEFQSYLTKKKKEDLVQIRGFRNDVETELKRVQNLPLNESEKATPFLTCSNLPFLEALWSTAKRTSGISKLASAGKGTIYRVLGTPSMDRSEKLRATIDIVAHNESEWIKLSNITERRILFDLAKSGWVEEDSSDDEDDFESEGILRVAFNLMQAAKTIRVKYRKPTVRLVLPKIRMRECHKEVLKILEKIKDLGIILETADDIPDAPLPLSEGRDRMIPDPFDGFTNTLNVDPTLLLAFVSDLSHDSVEPRDWHNNMIAYQIKMERTKQVLPAVLWPACRSRKLVCTREAANTALKIVGTIATDTERKRMELLLNLGTEVSELTREQRFQEFQKLSKYSVPSDWCLPIEIIDVDIENIRSKLPSAPAENVSQVLRGANPSVFFYGWESGYTTITSNRSVTLGIQRAVEQNLAAEETGPDIWICPWARSLVGKEKVRRGAIPEDAEEIDQSD